MVMNEEKKNTNWQCKWVAKPKQPYSNPVLIVGVPGIANVGKIAVDFIIEQKKAKKIAEFFSFDLPHLVFVREDNLAYLPKLEVYACKGTKEDLIFLGGDVQPSNERSCYEFCHTVIDLAQELGVKSIVTTGGIGLAKVPKNPQIYCTATDQKIIAEFTKIAKVNPQTHGVVGPIVGVTGVLIGVSRERGIPAIALLGETFSHPMYLGMTGARALLQVLNQRFSLKLNLKNLDAEILGLENEIALKTKELTDIDKLKKDQKLTYIG